MDRPLAPGPSGHQPFSAGRNYSFPWTNAGTRAAAPRPACAAHRERHLGRGGEPLRRCTTACTTGPTASASPRRTGTSRRRTTATRRRAARTTPCSASRRQVHHRRLSELPRPRQREHAAAAGRRLPITNMYLWQPLAGAFYAPCVDGDYDMAVIGHEYGHVIENRMIGKGGTRTGHHAGAMGESQRRPQRRWRSSTSTASSRPRGQPLRCRRLRDGQQARGIRNFGMNWPFSGAAPTPGMTPESTRSTSATSATTSPAPGARRRRDLERDELRHQPGLIDKYNASLPSDAALQRDARRA